MGCPDARTLSGQRPREVLNTDSRVFGVGCAKTFRILTMEVRWGAS
jgi:hypothetical protein